MSTGMHLFLVAGVSLLGGSRFTDSPERLMQARSAF